MKIKKASLKEWKKLGLPTHTMTISPYYAWDFKKNKVKKPVIVITNNNVEKNKK